MFSTLCQAGSSEESAASTPCASPKKKSRTEVGGKVGAVTGIPDHRSTSGARVKFKVPVEDAGSCMMPPPPGGVKVKIEGESVGSKVKAPTKRRASAAAKTGGGGVIIDLSGSTDPVCTGSGKVKTPSTSTSVMHVAQGNDRGLVIGGNLLCGRGLGKNVSRIERPKPPTPVARVVVSPQSRAQVQRPELEMTKTVSPLDSVCPSTSTVTSTVTTSSMAMVPRQTIQVSGTTSSASGTFSSGLQLVPYNPETTGATENRMVIYTPPVLADGSEETIGSGETSATPRIRVTSTPPVTTPLSQASSGTPPGSSPPTQGSSTVTGNTSPAPTVPYHISGEFLPFVPSEYIMSDDTSISDSESDRSCGWYPHRRCGPMSDEDLRERAKFEMTLEHDALGMDPECRPPWTESEVEMWIYRHFPLWSYDHWLGPPVPDHDASGFSPDSDVDMEPTPSDLGSGSPRASLSCPSSDSEPEASGGGAPRPVPPRYPDPLRCFCDPRLPDGIVRKNVCSFCYELAFPLQDLTL